MDKELARALQWARSQLPIGGHTKWERLIVDNRDALADRVLELESQLSEQQQEAATTEAILRQEIANLRVKEARLAEADKLLQTWLDLLDISGTRMASGDPRDHPVLALIGDTRAHLRATDSAPPVITFPDDMTMAERCGDPRIDGSAPAECCVNYPRCECDEADSAPAVAPVEYDHIGWQYKYPSAFGDGFVWRDNPHGYNNMTPVGSRKIYAERATEDSASAAKSEGA